MSNQTTAPQARKRRRKRKHPVLHFIKTCINTCVTIFFFFYLGTTAYKYAPYIFSFVNEHRTANISEQLEVPQEYPKEFLELLEKNEEAKDFVLNYQNRESYMYDEIDLSTELAGEKVPLLMQWDKRWGYNSYGKSCIGLSGCGPTCLTMAYLYFTGDDTMNPRSMATFCEKNGYYTTGGTSWSLWTEGVSQLGLTGATISLSESTMESYLDGGSLIICSMKPGDFTTTGHFILIYDYDENGFLVNDPNRKSTSSQQWDYNTLSHQIKNLWALSY